MELGSEKMTVVELGYQDIALILSAIHSYGNSLGPGEIDQEVSERLKLLAFNLGARMISKEHSSPTISNLLDLGTITISKSPEESGSPDMVRLEVKSVGITIHKEEVAKVLTQLYKDFF